MIKFKFRLEKLLMVRQKAEDAAKKAYLEARARRIAAEDELETMESQRQTAGQESVMDLAARILRDAYLTRLEDEIRAYQVTLNVVRDEEEQLRLAWIARKQDTEALSKLRENDWMAYQKEALRQEQIALDEWAVMRRVA